MAVHCEEIVIKSGFLSSGMVSPKSSILYSDNDLDNNKVLNARKNQQRRRKSKMMAKKSAKR